MERNSDLIKMQCYAPLFANVNPGAWQWGTNLIGYDALTAFGSPSYHAQVMFAQNRPDRLLPVRLDAPPQQPAAPTKPQGAAGLGAFQTDVEYQDFRITGPDGKVLLGGNAAADVKKWTFGEHALISRGNTIKPSAPTETCWGVVGDAKWTDYAITVKARKLGGEEGFLVLWHAADLETYKWWNIGGWGNTRTQFEVAQGGNRTPYGEASSFRAETGKWYDLRVEVRGSTARCFIDGVLVNEAADPPAAPVPSPLHANAGYIDGSKEVVIRVVNVGGQAIDGTVNLRGAQKVQPDGKAIVLRGEPRDVNTVAEPTKVAQKEEAIRDASGTLRRTVPPYSLTLIRLQADAE
jgi:alpha-L-arabinofuranosidase